MSDLRDMGEESEQGAEESGCWGEVSGRGLRGPAIGGGRSIMAHQGPFRRSLFPFALGGGFRAGERYRGRVEEALLFANDLSGDEELAFVLAGTLGKLEHDVEHDVLDDRAQAAGAGVLWPWPSWRFRGGRRG